MGHPGGLGDVDKRFHATTEWRRPSGLAIRTRWVSVLHQSPLMLSGIPLQTRCVRFIGSRRAWSNQFQHYLRMRHRRLGHPQEGTEADAQGEQGEQ